MLPKTQNNQMWITQEILRVKKHADRFNARLEELEDALGLLLHKASKSKSPKPTKEEGP